MEQWKEYRLSELCDILSGGTPKTTEPKYWGGGIPWLSVKDFGNVDKYVYTTEKTITNVGFEHCPSKMLQKDDIIISARGTVGAIAMISSSMSFNQSCFGLRGNDLVDKHFLYYLMHTKVRELRSNSHGSVFDTITRNTFDNIICSIPSKVIQHKIATILSYLDDKIELNHKINSNLEEQAKAIFKSWFIDFEPFKDGKFVDSELGKIPEGWKVLSLDNIADYLNGLAMQKYRPATGEQTLPVLKIKELGQGYCDASCDKCSSKVPSQYIVNDGDVIFSWSGTLMVDLWCGGKCGLNQHLFKVSSKDYPKWFYLMWTLEHLNRFIHIAKDKAVTMGHIKREELHKAKVVVPTTPIFNKANMLLTPIVDKMINTRICNRKLAAVRNALLPKLMSGEIDV